jgi:hypothetical protein
MTLNDVLKFYDSGTLENYPDETLKQFQVICGNNQITDLYFVQKCQFATDKISQILLSRQREKHHKEALAEQERLHGIKIANDQRLATEAAFDNDRKHSETSKLARKAIKVAWIAVWVAVAGVVVAVILGLATLIVAHLDSRQTPIAGVNATDTKKAQEPIKTPQIVLPTPKPIPMPTNLIQTNAAQNK